MTQASSHKFIHYLSESPPREAVREAAADLLNQYLGRTEPRSKLNKLPMTRISCFSMGADGKRTDWQSEPISLKTLELHLKGGTFDFKTLNLFDPQCRWLDASVELSPSFHAIGSDGKALTFQTPTNIGSNFPIVPRLDREGSSISSPQLGIQRRILQYREELVDRSAAFHGQEYFHVLRQLASECVTLIDVTLHQLYYRAKYDRPINWNFDAQSLGPPRAARLEIKLNWVYKITGRHINAQADMHAFHRIRSLRNHVQHFDPPCFCFTVEDVVDWLNDVLAVARLARQIRRAMDATSSVPLLELLLLRPVCFVPADPARPRLPQPPTVGYASSTWPREDDDTSQT